MYVVARRSMWGLLEHASSVSNASCSLRDLMNAGNTSVVHVSSSPMAGAVVTQPFHLFCLTSWPAADLSAAAYSVSRLDWSADLAACQL